MIKRYGLGAVTVFLVVGCGKPHVEQTCTMNGFGQGECSFTNTGTAAGSVCGKVVVQKKRDATETSESSVFCSGEVGKQSTTKVDFKIPSVNTMCSGGPWQENCEFSFKSNDGSTPPPSEKAAAPSKGAANDQSEEWANAVCACKEVKCVAAANRKYGIIPRSELNAPAQDRAMKCMVDLPTAPSDGVTRLAALNAESQARCLKWADEICACKDMKCVIEIETGPRTAYDDPTQERTLELVITSRSARSSACAARYMASASATFCLDASPLPLCQPMLLAISSKPPSTSASMSLSPPWVASRLRIARKRPGLRCKREIWTFKS